MTGLRTFFLLLTFNAAAVLPAALWADPPSRVGRLNLIEGSVSYRPADSDEWTPATLNYPLTTGDQVWTEAGARAEAHVGQAAIRLAPETDFSVALLDDQTVRLQLSQGSLDVRLRGLEPDELFEVVTPEASITLREPGSYRIDFLDSTDIVVRSGEAELAVEGSSVRVSDNQYAVVSDAASGSFQLRVAPAPDQWEAWCLDRDRNEDRYASSRHVPPAVVGYEDLEAYGSWVVLPEYGECWRPLRVHAGWAPYRFGRWSWVAPWGWTWIDDEPWGFAPFHYGRWTYLSGTWFWVPGAIGLRPVYAPALVVFLGGEDWGFSFGVGDGVGWFPLGPREIYIPPYGASRVYIQNINITYVKNVDIEHFDVRHGRYKNRSVEGAVTVVPRQAFVRAQRVDRAAITVGQAELGRAPVKGMDPSLSPERESVPGREAGKAAPRPPQAVRNRRAATPSEGRLPERTMGAPFTYGEQQAQPPARVLPTPDRKQQTMATAEEQRRAAAEKQKRTTVGEEQMRAAAEEQQRAAVEQQRRAAAEEQRRTTVEQQRQAEQERSRGPAVQPETGRREKQPKSNAPVKKKRKMVWGPNGWEWVWVEEKASGGN